MRKQKYVKKAAVSALLALLLPFCLTACTKEDAQAVMAKARENMAGIESISYDIVIDMEMSGEGETLASTTKATVDYILQPAAQMKLDMTMDMNGLGSIDTSVYVTEENGTYTVYTGMGTGSNMAWFASQSQDMDAVLKYDAAANLDLYLSTAEAFEAAGEDRISETAAIRYDGTIPKEVLEQVMEVSGMNAQFEQFGMTGEALNSIHDIMTDLDDLPISIWIAKDSYIPMKYQMDMTGMMQAVMSNMLEQIGEDPSAIKVERVFASMTMLRINDVAPIDIPEEALAAADTADAASGLASPAPSVEITEDNYQSLFHVAQEMGYQYLGCAYHKAPDGMFSAGQFVDAYLPYGDDLVYSDDGASVQSSAHGMAVSQTICHTDGNAQTVVDDAYEQLAASGLPLYEAGVAETEYSDEYDIAYKQITYFENDGTIPRIALLYADRKQENYYLYAQITYLPEQMDDDYPALLEELSDAFGMTLPQFEPYSPAQ